MTTLEVSRYVVESRQGKSGRRECLCADCGRWSDFGCTYGPPEGPCVFRCPVCCARFDSAIKRAEVGDE